MFAAEHTRTRILRPFPFVSNIIQSQLNTTAVFAVTFSSFTKIGHTNKAYGEHPMTVEGQSTVPPAPPVGVHISRGDMPAHRPCHTGYSVTSAKSRCSYLKTATNKQKQGGRRGCARGGGSDMSKDRRREEDNFMVSRFFVLNTKMHIPALLI